VKVFLPAAMAVLAVLPWPALAAPAEDPAVAEAKAHLNKARLHYKLGEFDDAANAFKEAYRLRPVPGLLFNLGQACRMAGRLKEAKFYYENYLADMPDAPNRAEVQVQLEQIAKLLGGTPPEAKADAKPAEPTAPDARTAAAGATRTAAPGVTSAEKPAAPGAERPAAPPPAAEEAGTPGAVPAAALPEAALETVPAADPTRWRTLRLGSAAAAAALAVSAGVVYALARSAWSELRDAEHPRAHTDELLASANARYHLSLGLAGGAVVAGAVVGVTFVLP